MEALIVKHICKIAWHFWVYTISKLWNNIFPALNIPVIYLKEEAGNPLTEGPEYSLLGFLIQSRKTLSMECFHSGGNLFKITLNTIWQTPSGIIFCELLLTFIFPRVEFTPNRALTYDKYTSISLPPDCQQHFFFSSTTIDSWTWPEKKLLYI